MTPEFIRSITITDEKIWINGELLPWPHKDVLIRPFPGAEDFGVIVDVRTVALDEARITMSPLVVFIDDVPVRWYMHADGPEFMWDQTYRTTFARLPFLVFTDTAILSDLRSAS